MVELVRYRKFSIEHTPARPAVSIGGAARARNHFGQPMVGLRPQNNVDVGRTPKDLLAFGLRNAASDGDHHAATRRRPVFLQSAQPAELRIHFLARLFAYMASVQYDHIRIIRRIARGIAERCQDIRHAGGVVDIHLTAIRLDEEFLGHARYADRQATVQNRVICASKFAAKAL